MEKEKPDFSNMPTGDQVRAFVTQLESYPWEKYKIELPINTYKANMEKTLREITGGFSLLLRRFNGVTKLPFYFYRIRAFDEIKNIHSRSEYSYPPASIPSHQRANLPGYPALYASDHPLTAILEVIRSHQNINDFRDKYFCLSVWKMKGEQSAFLAPLLHDGIPVENPFYKFGLYQRGKEPAQMKETFTPEQIDGCEEVQKFFSRIFHQDDRYTISSFLAHLHMYNEVNVPLYPPELQIRADIVIYPSMRRNKKTINYAIHPNFVDERMTLNTVYKVKVDDISVVSGEPIDVTMSLEEFAINNMGYIIWLQANRYPELLRKRQEEDFPHIIGEFGFK